MYVAVVPNRGPRPAILLRESYRDGDKGQEPHAEEPVGLAGRADPAAARGAARGDAGAGGRGFGDRACLAARTRVGGTRHGAPDRARPAAAAPAGAAAKAGAGADRGAADRSGGQAGDGAGARRDDGDPLARRDPRAGRGHRQGGLRGARLAGPGSAGDREGARQAPSRGRLPRPLRSHLELSRGPLLRAADGCPIAVEVFEGDTADPSTLAGQIAKIKDRFGLKRVVLVGDRGLITSARIEEELQPAGLDWITALRAPAIRTLAADGGPLQLSLFDERDLAEIESPDYPGERLVVCRNPALAEERARKRSELLAATEREFERIQARIRR